MISKTASRNAFVLACLVSALAATSPAMAQALEPVVRVSTIARDTVIGITLLLMTVGVMAGCGTSDVVAESTSPTTTTSTVETSATAPSTTSTPAASTTETPATSTIPVGIPPTSRTTSTALPSLDGKVAVEMVSVGGAESNELRPFIPYSGTYSLRDHSWNGDELTIVIDAGHGRCGRINSVSGTRKGTALTLKIVGDTCGPTPQGASTAEAASYSLTLRIPGASGLGIVLG